MSADLGALKARQQAAWTTAYNDVGVRLVIMAERLCETADVRYGENVLDVACGNGNVALAAARRFARVTGVDYAPPLVEHARERARADGLEVDFRVGDAEALEFADGSFDAVLSSIGVMFVADQEAAARELLRVTRPGGRIALANWVPGGFVAGMFQTVGRVAPPPAGARSPVEWAEEGRLRELFGADVKIELRPDTFFMRSASAEGWLAWFRVAFGPIVKAFEVAGPDRERELADELVALARRFDVAGDGTLKLRMDYVEVLIRTP